MRRTALLLALAASLLLAACGQSAEERFRTNDLRPLTHQMEQRQNELAAVLESARIGNRRDARAVRNAVQDIAATADRLAALQPPSSARDAFTRYTTANSHLLRALRGFARAMRSSSLESRLSAASTDAQDAAGEVRRAENALDAALTG